MRNRVAAVGLAGASFLAACSGSNGKGGEVTPPAPTTATSAFEAPGPILANAERDFELSLKDGKEKVVIVLGGCALLTHKRPEGNFDVSIIPNPALILRTEGGQKLTMAAGYDPEKQEYLYGYATIDKGDGNKLTNPETPDKLMTKGVMQFPEEDVTLVPGEGFKSVNLGLVMTVEAVTVANSADEAASDPVVRAVCDAAAQPSEPPTTVHSI